MKIKLIKLIYKSVQDSIPLNQLMQKVRDVIQDIPDFNVREKAKMYVLVKKTAKLMYIQNGNLENSQLKTYYSGINKVSEHANSRKRKQNLAGMMRNNRAKGGVFYICSTHSNPATDHAEWQGRIYVDRYWRNTLEGDEIALKKVAAYIRNHDIKTVQEICREPVYLITRPYCKHFFIELDTDEVLNSSLNSIKKNHPEAIVKTHNINYRKKYYRFRAKVRSVLNPDK